MSVVSHCAFELTFLLLLQLMMTTMTFSFRIANYGFVRSQRPFHLHPYQFNPYCYSSSTIARQGGLFTTNKQEHKFTTTATTTTTTTKPQLIIHWKGECDKHFSAQFRQLEFLNSLAAVWGKLQESTTTTNTTINSIQPPTITFTNALECNIDEFGQEQVDLYNEAMQYITLAADDDNDSTRHALYDATERCSLVHAIYQIMAVGHVPEDLAPKAIENGGFADMVVTPLPNDGTSSNNKNYQKQYPLTWCVRARNYGGSTGRHSEKARSMTLEQSMLIALTPLLKTFTGKAHLANPDCKIYVFDGLLGTFPMILARRRARGPLTFTIAPTTRICITNTPLPPTAAFTLCNVARIRNGQTILDPYGGSCTILLAAAMLAPECQSVAIDIAPPHILRRDHVLQDFETRGLCPPLALIHGDCTSLEIRDQARAAIFDNTTTTTKSNDGFDVICTDPPYGVRESAKYNELNPLDHLFLSIAQDAEQGKRLVKVGGRVVAFVPVMEEEVLEDCMPSKELTQQAGLELEMVQEQVLNERLSRWMVAYQCVR